MRMHVDDFRVCKPNSAADVHDIAFIQTTTYLKHKQINKVWKGCTGMKKPKYIKVLNYGIL